MRIVRDTAVRLGLDYAGAEVYAESVSRGCKPVAGIGQWEGLSSEDITELTFDLADIAECWGIHLYTHCFHIDGREIYEFLFYKHWHIGEVLDELYRHEPRDVLYHWIWGKLFGYSEQEIGEFIEHEAWLDAGQEEDP